MVRGCGTLLLAGLIVLFPVISFSATINVPADQPTIQAGIDTAINGDTVLVVPGTYSGPGNRDISLDGKSLVIIAPGGPTVTVIEIGGSAVEPHSGFLLEHGENTDTKIIGFCLTGGYDSTGAGMRFTFGSKATIYHCEFINNHATRYGGGIYIFGATPIIDSWIRIRNERLIFAILK